ncbi:MAG: helix-turn-helix domain-containing protein, partial [Myxococcales bacterium]|nr:helix-turn-helix domain-containing protein [Myxococcales bacterium]
MNMDTEETAAELVRAVRGTRSQRAFARRLGFRGNPIANWESGRRSPTADVLLAAAQTVGIDVRAALARFHPATAPAYGEGGPAGVASWLSALRGQLSSAEVARNAGLSRFAVTRWMNGSTRPRLPDFLLLVDAITGRVPDLVAELVDIEAVPSLIDRHRRARASRRLAFELPWTEAVVRVLEASGPLDRDAIAAALGLAGPEVDACLAGLAEAGLVRRRGDGWRAVGELTVDTRDAPEAMVDLKAHWASLGVQRARALRPGDLVSYNVISVSRADLARIRQLHVDYFMAVRAIVAESEPEVAALVNVQLIGFDPVGQVRQHEV